MTPEVIKDLITEAEHDIRQYPYNQYLHYPALSKDKWIAIFRENLTSFSRSGEWTFFGGKRGPDYALIGCRISDWDKDHFGFHIAGVRVFFSSLTPGGEAFKSDMLSACVAYLRGKGIARSTARVHGDDLATIHFLEELGYRYYEDIVWPVLDTRSISDRIPGNLRMMKREDLDRVKFIASHFQYERGHFHCDAGFPKDLVNAMYAKWAETAFNRNGTVAVIELEGMVAGYFVYQMDRSLSDHLGYSYGRLQSLAVDSSVRGRGIGKQLFDGTLALIKQSGGQYIDSGYATKNHISTKLHCINGFRPVYEEVTLHNFL